MMANAQNGEVTGPATPAVVPAAAATLRRGARRGARSGPLVLACCLVLGFAGCAAPQEEAPPAPGSSYDRALNDPMGYSPWPDQKRKTDPTGAHQGTRPARIKQPSLKEDLEHHVINP